MASDNGILVAGAPVKAPPKQLPALIIGYDADRQAVEFKFSPEDFKTWDFVIGILAMADLKAKTNRQIAMAQEQMKRAQDEALKEHVVNKLARS